MQYTARWGPKGFLVSPNRVVPFMGFQSTVSVKADAQNDTSGTAQTNRKGRELQPISFSTIYLRAAGVDPRAQVEEWEALVGESHPLIIGGKRFGPAKLMLESVSTSEVLTANDGTFLQANVSLNFKEYSEESAVTVAPADSEQAESESASSASATQAAAVYAATVAEKKAALSTGASKADKATKKIDRMVMAQ